MGNCLWAATNTLIFTKFPPILVSPFFFEDAEDCLEENFYVIGKRDIVDIFQLHVTALRVADVAPARCLPKAHGTWLD